MKGIKISMDEQWFLEMVGLGYCTRDLIYHMIPKDADIIHMEHKQIPLFTSAEQIVVFTILHESFENVEDLPIFEYYLPPNKISNKVDSSLS